ncbi:MAG: DJ-1/PfpI family protein [Bacteroidales bacterium]|nr:DJ-1/PfpI family protein [Bacteroidales bacterium]
MKGVFVFLADGFEEIEALATVDILKRGGVDVLTVSNDLEGFVTGSHGITVCPDMTLDHFMAELRVSGTEPADVLIFPGGLPGAQNLADNPHLMAVMARHWEDGGTVAAICAAPGLVVSKLPGLPGHKFTCYTGFESATQQAGGEYTGEPVEVSGALITGRGPGCAIPFALAILERVAGAEVAAKVKAGLLLP